MIKRIIPKGKYCDDDCPFSFCETDEATEDRASDYYRVCGLFGGANCDRYKCEECLKEFGEKGAEVKIEANK